MQIAVILYQINEGMRKRVFLAILFFFTIGLIYGQNLSREEYISNYSDLAMKEMKRTGIPASITLAQGCLESDNGNSSLTQDGKNHFGIKCHDWTGRKIYHDDDEKHECFRKYKSDYDSYMDHSLFLSSKARYAFLFELKPDDYKAWAQGLKRAGYATSNKYAVLLIKIIEENDLHKYDQIVLQGSGKLETIGNSERARKSNRTGKYERKQAVVSSNMTRKIFENNGIEYIIAIDGDSQKSLREELDLYPGEVYRYNELAKGAVLDSGMVLYLQPKKMKAYKGIEIHVVQEGEMMWEISQVYGIKLKYLYKLNNMRFGTEAEPGFELQLRRKVKEAKHEIFDEKEEEPEEEEMEFEFEG